MRADGRRQAVIRVLLAASRTFLAVGMSWYLAFFAALLTIPWSPSQRISWWTWAVVMLSYAPAVFLWKTSDSRLGRWTASAVATLFPAWVTIEAIGTYF